VPPMPAAQLTALIRQSGGNLGHIGVGCATWLCTRCEYGSHRYPLVVPADFWGLVLCRYCLGGVRAGCLLAWHRRCLCRGLADGGGRPY
jgi:hypothetical protein